MDILKDGSLELANPVELPEVLDLLVVGGGPAGTAAAFRGQELGLSVLVIDYDDLMKRIRDYAKDKLILPHFGGGDQMRFPAGGELVKSLHFEPIDKDDICREWRDLYKKHSVPAKIGIELTGFSRKPDGLLEVKTWNHRLQKEEIMVTRHLALSIGRGVPRRFDIPGNTDGISYRLEDALMYVGRPVCVIGGGTSAAEAVIAISTAKAEANDTCPIYWSYRGDSMPKVSRALSEVFFNAYLGNGNIRYYPNSEPVAILTGPDRNEYLSICVDRRTIDGRSIETTHLEFPKQSCIACIGEDIPEQFLNAMGIRMMEGGSKKKKRMVVTPLLETQQQNVYLIGDILSQRYLETEDFEADPVTFKEVRHPGNIKSALRDGVFVAEVVKQKMEGRTSIDVSISFVGEPEVASHVVSREAEDSAVFLKETTAESEEKEVQEEGGQADDDTFAGRAPLKVEQPAPQEKFIRITQTDVEEDEYILHRENSMSIGRADVDVAFPSEASLSDKHATLFYENGKYHLRDEGSRSGTFYRLPAGKLATVKNGDLVQMGRQFLVFNIGSETRELLQYDRKGTLKSAHPLKEGTVVIGREGPDIVLDVEDTILSRRHMAISVKGTAVQVKDLGSLNHSYLRVKDPYPLSHDDVFRLGQFEFRLSTEEAGQEPAKRVSVAALAKSTAPPRAVAEPEVPVSKKASHVSEAAEPPATTGPSVTFLGHGGPIVLSPDDNVLSVARNNKVPINYECESGRCGYDPVRIVSGQEHLNELDEDEEGWTLEEVCHLKPGEYRLACMLKCKGPVVVEVVKK